MKTKFRVYNFYRASNDPFEDLTKVEADIMLHLNSKELKKVDWDIVPNTIFEIDLPEKKSVLSSISDNDLLNELIDRLIVNTKYSDREKLFEVITETWKKRLFGEIK